jgi:Tfp pilus assembly protein PilO
MRIERDQVKTLIVFAILLVGFSVGLWLPARAERARLQERIDSARDTLGMDLAQSKGLVKLHQVVTELRQTCNGAQQYVPQEDEMADVLRGLTESLVEMGVREQEVTTREVKHFAHYSVIPLELNFHSSFPMAYEVLRQIESRPRLIRIDNLEIQGDLQKPQQPLEIHLELSTFFSRKTGGQS